MPFCLVSTSVEERIVGKSVQQRCLFHDLEDRVLDRWSIGVWQGVEVYGNNGDSIRELLCWHRSDNLSWMGTDEVLTNILAR